nr:MAG TPA: hypothetical protein [Caudoviricetes sp.]
MIDSVLKGTGNSRFLKSAVPAGTSWADALAMLQAGTFPIDFNGINAEGFQQVGTPLNKANLLKDATAAQIGLPPSTTPDGMFQALGNTGELHVWRKTVKTSSDTPAGYTLGTAQSNLRIPTAGQTVDFVYSASITVGNDGTVSQPSSGTKRAFATSAYVSAVQSVLAGKFFTVKNDYGSVIDGVWYCPSSLTVSVSGNDIILSQAQKVNAHGIIPAGTTTTYPVSTNPNAYQEGDDAKPAGYTLGEVVMGSFRMSGTAPRNAYLYKYANSVAVKENGEVVLQNPEAVNFNSDSHIGYESTVLSLVAGKFLYYYGRDSMADDSSAPDTQPPFNATPSEIVYVPADAAITATSTYPAGFYLDKYQPVTGYAAIPAGTAIEYLGKLGDKARVQVLSYVGTGTYGSSNPNSLTFDFVPKVIIVSGFFNTYSYSMILSPQTGTGVSMQGSDRGYVYRITCKETDRAVSWYAGSYSDQLNASGIKYVAIAIG